MRRTIWAQTAPFARRGNLPLTDLALVRTLLIALGIGLLVGAERERRNAARTVRGPAGLRTFAVAALAGAVAMIAGGPMLLAVPALAAALLAAASHWREPNDGDRGLTTELALVLTVLLGGLVPSHATLAGAGAVTLAVVLVARDPLHRFVGNVLSETELSDALVLLGGALVLLPLLPDRAMGPYAAINPRSSGIVVLMIFGITALGEVAVRMLGARLGVPVLGLVSGFASSSATIAAMGARVRANTRQMNASVAAALLSAVATFVQIIAVIAATDRTTLALALVPCLAAAGTALALGAGFATLAWRDPPGAEIAHASGVRLAVAAGFAVVLAVMLIAVAALRASFGGTGLLAAAGVGGVIDVHAASIAIAAQVADGALAPPRALLPLLVAWSTSTAVKVVLALGAGPRGFGWRVAPGLVLILGAAWVAAWLV